MGQASASFEERQVAAAITKARALRPDLYSMSGGSDSLSKGDLSGGLQERISSPLEEREKREREERLRAVYAGLAETLQRTNDPEAMTILTRTELASIEAVPEAPELDWIKYPQRELRGKATNCELALKFGNDPRLAKELGLEEKRLVPRVIERPALRRTEDGYEMSLIEEGEAVMLRAAAQMVGLNKFTYPYEVDGGWKISLSFDEYRALKRYPSKDVAKIFQKTERIVEPPLYTQEQLKQIKEASERLHKEILVRTKLTIAWYLYRYGEPPGFVDLNALARLGGRYTGISNKEFYSLFSSEPTKEGETKFGDKIDLALRLFCLIAMAKKKNRDESSSTEDETRKKNIEQALLKQPPELSSRKDDLLGKILELGGKNVFCQRVEGGDPVTEMVDWIKGVIKGDPDDSAAAVELGRRFFFIFGIAAHFDYREEKGPSGAANSDVTATIQYFNSWRRDQAKNKYPHGPDATLDKYPETLISSFFHSTILYEKKDQRDPKVTEGKTLWEIWWDEGKRLRELPWSKLAEGAWFGYNFALSSLGKEKSVYDMGMEPLLRDLLKAEALQALKRSIDRGVQAISILGSDRKEWLKRIKEEIDTLRKDGYNVNIQKDPEDLTPKELNNKLLMVKRRQILELILIGAITESYRDDPDETVKKIGFLHTGSEPPQLRTRKRVFLNLINRVGCDPDSVLKRSKKFLEELGYSPGGI